MNRQLFLSFTIVLITITPWFNTKAAPAYLIYTSNINGFLQNCGCGSEPLGGIGRIKHFIDTFKTKHPNVLLIDGGDYFNSYPFPGLDEAMSQVLKLMSYDVLVPGDQEFVEGEQFFRRLSSDYSDKLVLTNANSNHKKVLYTQIADKRVAIYGLLCEEVFDFVEVPADLTLTSLFDLPGEVKSADDLNIVVIHGFLSDAQAFAQKFQTVDLILLSHDQSRGVWNTNGVTILGNGKDSEYISVVKAEYKRQWKFEVNQIKISESIPEDKDVLKIIEDFNKQIKLN